MANCNLIVKSTKPNAAVYIRYTNGRNCDLTVPTGMFVNPAHWSKEKQLLKNIAGLENRNELNTKLTTLKLHVLNQANTDFSNGVILSKSWLTGAIHSFFNRPKQEIKLKNEPHTIYLSDFCLYWLDNHADKWKVAPGKFMDAKAKTHYKKVYKDLLVFEDRDKVKLRETDADFIEGFTGWLEEKDYSESTVRKMIDRLRFFIARASDLNFEIHQGYKSKIFIAEREEVEDVFLNENEISMIMNHDFSDNLDLEAAADNFVLSCRTALRVSDLLYNLDTKSIRDGIIHIKTKKTGKRVAIPLHPDVKYILSKRFGQLPAKMPENKYNLLIKEVCRVAGIDNIVFGRLFDAKMKRKVVGYYPKYKLISSHVGRRSFATLLKGHVPDEVIMSCAGWSSSKLLNFYNKTSKVDYANQLGEYFEKSTLKQ